MTAPRRGVLYTTDLLALATEVAQHPFDADAKLIGEARSRSCGSTLTLSLDIDDHGNIDRTGLRLSACVIGQAAAAIFTSAAHGRNHTAIAAAHNQIVEWLGGGGSVPDWPRIEQLSPALDHPGRHGAIELPWRAALDALSKAKCAG